MAVCITKVRLLNVPLESDQLHTLYFTSYTEQASYFMGQTVYSEDDFSYQRKDKVIRYPRHIDSLLGCNYVMYQNTEYSNKWYYAFITKMEYVNDNHTDIYIETDAIQTWLLTYKVKPSFVEREHVDDDTIGKHTVPEQLETGDYIINSKNRNGSLLVYSYVMGCTVDLNSSRFDGVGGRLYNGIYSGIKYYLMNDSQLTKAINALAEAGKADAITCIFVCPSVFVSATTPEGGSYAEVNEGAAVVKKDWINTFGIEDSENYKPEKIDGYKPHNNKLLTHPYSYMLMSNNAGGAAVYKYELFDNPDDPNHCAFWIYGSITPGMSIRIIPLYYNGVGANNEEGLNLGKYPICGWTSDVYTNWLTQNAVNIAINTVGNVASIVGGAVVAAGTGGLGTAIGGGGVASGINGIANTVAQIYQHAIIPPQAEGNLNSGDVTMSSGNLTFTAYHMSIKAEYARIIDGYFNMFGYKVNRVKTPLSNHRPHYWYTKTIDVNIDGAIPMEDMTKIKAAYNKGITFWKNPVEIGDYTVDNRLTE